MVVAYIFLTTHLAVGLLGCGKMACDIYADTAGFLTTNRPDQSNGHIVHFPLIYKETKFSLLDYRPLCVLDFNQYAAFFNIVHYNYMLKQIS